jgi:hypothetical protein
MGKVLSGRHPGYRVHGERTLDSRQASIVQTSRVISGNCKPSTEDPLFGLCYFKRRGS